MCRLVGESRAGYYRHWQAHEPRAEEMGLRDAIQRLALAYRHYGYRRIGAQLRREGWCVNAKRVLRLMRKDNLLCLRQRAFVPATTDSLHGYKIYPNLARHLETTAVNQLWVADITYVRLTEDFVYLAVLLDGHSRRVVGWALADHLRASLALAALDMALAMREVAPGGLVHHSDRGVQYACSDYVARLETRGIVISMSRIACPYDNAMAESFMKTLKTEEVEGRPYRDLAHATSDIGAFIEQVYNKHRLHSALAYRSPEEFENETTAPGAAAQQPRVPPTICP
jgi:transposase InsO family protein